MSALPQDAPAPAFGPLLTLCRIRAGLSQRALADATGVTASTLRDYERGRWLPSVATMQALVPALGLPDADAAALWASHRAVRPPLQLAERASPFGRALRRYRLRAGMSQLALGKEAGINASFINRVERGDRAGTSAEVVRALAVALNLSAWEQDALLLAAGHAPSYARDRTVRLLARLYAEAPQLVAAVVRGQIEAAAGVVRAAREGGE